MKFFNRFLLLVALFSVIACSKDDDTSGGGEDDIIGIWELTILDYEGTSSTVFGGDTFTSDFMGSGRNMTASVEFKTDGTYLSMGTYTIDLTTSFGGQSITQAITISNFLGTGTYEINGDIITVTDDQNMVPQDVTLTKLDGDDMEMDYIFVQSTTEQGITSTTTIDGHYTFKRK